MAEVYGGVIFSTERIDALLLKEDAAAGRICSSHSKVRKSKSAQSGGGSFGALKQS